MFKPKYEITDKINNTIFEIAEIKGIISHAKLIPNWEIKLEVESLINSTYSNLYIDGFKLLNKKLIKDIFRGKFESSKNNEYIIDTIKKYFNAEDYLSKINNTKRFNVNKDDIFYLHKLLNNTELKNKKNIYDLIIFINNKDIKINPVLKAGIIHYEFYKRYFDIEGIEKTIRILCKLILIIKKFDNRRFFNIDDYYKNKKSTYFRMLNKIKKNTLSLTEWLEYYCDGIRISLLKTKNEVIFLTNSNKKIYSKKCIELNEYHKRILDLIEERGKISSKELQCVFNNINYDFIYRKLKYLILHRFIRKIGRGRGISIKYVLAEKYKHKRY